jgi:hypothetical protein
MLADTRSGTNAGKVVRIEYSNIPHDGVIGVGHNATGERRV